ncbi:MAG: hypothetical protein M1835_000967 [Candelina submexicana]|nr:MAG: hypothetical protein M1835_000967 [Candelina submexicana]
MKVLIADVTNYVGWEILQQCINHPSITSIIAISSFPLPDFPKVRSIDLTKFDACPATFLEDLEGIEVCLWSLGDSSVLTTSKNREHREKVNTDFTLKAAAAILHGVGLTMPKGKSLKFVRCDGWDSDMDEEMSVVSYTNTPVEQGLFNIAENNKGKFAAYVMRPALRPALDSKTVTSHRLAIGDLPRWEHRIGADNLAVAMIEIGLKGVYQYVWGHLDLVKFAADVRSKKPTKRATKKTMQSLTYAEVASLGARLPFELIFGNV